MVKRGAAEEVAIEGGGGGGWGREAWETGEGMEDGEGEACPLAV